MKNRASASSTAPLRRRPLGLRNASGKVGQPIPASAPEAIFLITRHVVLARCITRMRSRCSMARRCRRAETLAPYCSTRTVVTASPGVATVKAAVRPAQCSW
jgi:hypothetical protein